MRVIGWARRGEGYEQNMNWHCTPFGELGPTALYDLLALRSAVFVVEQRCAYLDPDGLDPKALHVYAYDTSGILKACARILPAGVSHPEASIGRVCIALSERRTGLGRELMERTLAYVHEHYGQVPLRISAQEYLVEFYSSFGFEKVSEPYLEDGIPHVEMYRG